MDIPDQRLERHFRDLSDDALLRTLDSGDLTEHARRAALAETSARGLDLDAARARVAATADAESLDADGGDMTGSAPPRNAAAFRSWTELVAWIYFALMVAAQSFLVVAELTLWRRGVLVWTFAAATALDIVCSVGFWGWLQQRRVGPRALWVVCAAAKSVEILVAAVTTLGARDWRQFMIAGLALPLVFALWRYALAGPWASARSSLPARM